MKISEALKTALIGQLESIKNDLTQLSNNGLIIERVNNTLALVTGNVEEEELSDFDVQELMRK